MYAAIRPVAELKLAHRLLLPDTNEQLAVMSVESEFTPCYFGFRVKSDRRTDGRARP